MTNLRAVELTVRYGAQVAVSGVSLDVVPGSPLSILGPNGAGKSSTLMALTGLIEPASGVVEVDGRTGIGKDSRWFLKNGVALVPEGARSFRALSVIENLEIPLHALRLRSRESALKDVFDLFPVLGERKRQAAGLLSGGEQKMLAIGRGLMSGPKVMCIDEPTLGLAPVVINDISSALCQLSEAGMAILVSEQNLPFVEALGGSVVVLERGIAKWRGPAAGVSREDAAMSALIGKGVRSGTFGRAVN